MARNDADKQTRERTLNIGDVNLNDPSEVRVGCHENDDGTVSLVFDDVAGVVIWANTIDDGAQFLGAVTQKIARHILDYEDERARTGNTSGDAELTMRDLSEMGIVTIVYGDMHAMRCTDVPHAVLLSKSAEAHAAAFNAIFRGAVAFIHTIKEALVAGGLMPDDDTSDSASSDSAPGQDRATHARSQTTLRTFGGGVLKTKTVD